MGYGMHDLVSNVGRVCGHARGKRDPWRVDALRADQARFQSPLHGGLGKSNLDSDPELLPAISIANSPQSCCGKPWEVPCTYAALASKLDFYSLNYNS